MFRKGSCVFKDKGEETVKCNENGKIVKRYRNKAIIEHCDIIGDKFWKDHADILRDGNTEYQRSGNNKYEYLKSFEVEDKLMQSTWVVVRLDGRCFHKFSDKHEFEKPNDERALNLMNACAKAVLEEFPDIIFAYGVSDEYSFVFKKTTMLYNRRSSDIISTTVAFFTLCYNMKWKEFFPDKDLKSTPSFDARTVCYPSTKIVRDYLAWRQVDCHINNQYNTCFWMLVKSGKNKSEAQDEIKSSRSQDKYEILLKQFNMNYNELPAIFRKGSCVEETAKCNDNGQPVERLTSKVVIDHPDIIGDEFWVDHRHILKGNTTPN
ncbi:hypothetical protein MKW94_014960 [Papaver nudicaule]|uniref:tRNA(His) guanylyltransferase n=1 Tax=Papaver nudicaule TaxID=74823 RepID=A0AA41VUN0_PAPNU|nr:hypothetical protein [Papaver nudicaule]